MSFSSCFCCDDADDADRPPRHAHVPLMQQQHYQPTASAPRFEDLPPLQPLIVVDPTASKPVRDFQVGAKIHHLSKQLTELNSQQSLYMRHPGLAQSYLNRMQTIHAEMVRTQHEMATSHVSDDAVDATLNCGAGRRDSVLDTDQAAVFKIEQLSERQQRYCERWAELHRTAQSVMEMGPGPEFDQHCRDLDQTHRDMERFPHRMSAAMQQVEAEQEMRQAVESAYRTDPSLLSAEQRTAQALYDQSVPWLVNIAHRLGVLVRQRPLRLAQPDGGAGFARELGALLGEYRRTGAVCSAFAPMYQPTIKALRNDFEETLQKGMTKLSPELAATVEATASAASAAQPAAAQPAAAAASGGGVGPSFAVDACPVCDAEPDATFVTLTCRHVFCAECVAAIQRTRPFCPMCRAPLAAAASASVAAADAAAPSEADLASWDVAAVSRIRKIEFSKDGNMLIDDGRGGLESTNVFVHPGAQVSVSAGAQIFVQGRLVENPQQQCQQQ